MNSVKICKICRKEFTAPYIMKRYMKNIHKIDVPVSRIGYHIICVLCPEKEKQFFVSYGDSEKHLMMN